MIDQNIPFLKNFIEKISHPKLSHMLRVFSGVIGFVLSPLSWWNDVFVNFPLAYGLAWGWGKLLDLFIDIHKWVFIYLFIGGYFLTNLIGFLMIHYSIFGLKKGSRNSIAKQILVSFFYTLIVILFFGLDICDPQNGCPVFPSWVQIQER